MSGSLPPKKRRMINYHNNSGSAFGISAASSSSSNAGSFLPQLLQTKELIPTSQRTSLRSTVSVSSSNSRASHNSNYSNGSSYTDTDTPIQTIAYPPRPQQPRKSFIHHLCNIVIVPNTNTTRPNPKKPVSKKTTSHNKKRNPRNTLVKDVDGNDMCMGYFSMPTSQRRSSPPVEEEETAH